MSRYISVGHFIIAEWIFGIFFNEKFRFLHGIFCNKKAFLSLRKADKISSDFVKKVSSRVYKGDVELVF